MARPKLLFYTHGLVDGGAERLWASLASELKSRGYQVVFAVDFDAHENRAQLDPAIRLATLGPGHIKSVLALARLLRAERPDIAFSAVGGSNLKLLMAKALARASVKTVISYHGLEEWRTGWLSYLTFLGLPLFSRAADRTVAVSEGLTRDLTAHWRAFAPRQRTLHNPVFLPKDIPLPEKSALAARPDHILAVGRLVPEKDFATLIRAFARLDRPGAKLTILGKGPEQAALEALIRHLGLDGRVTLAGYSAQPWVHYATAKCLALSSRSEQFGNVIVEAMAHGLPVIATRATGPSEILANGAFGRLVEIGDEAGLAQALAETLKDPGDPAAHQARAREFSLAARVPAYEALIKELVQEAHTPPQRVYLDLTHLGRHVTGIERISIEQFEKQSFRGAEVRPVRSRGTVQMVLKQQLWLPLLALFNPRAIFVFPGFPPSPVFALARSRTVLYVHDLFLMTRRQDLGLKAKLYMAAPFRIAVKRLKYFMVNSEKTRGELAAEARADAQIALYRPVVRNVFGLTHAGRSERPERPAPLRIVMVGTVEPRKNYAAALAIRAALEAQGYPAELHIVGREGWGNAVAQLKADPKVTVHGYMALAEARRIIESADLYLSTSHDEGLGLPLIEAQFAGLPVVAPDITVFREVLGSSGVFVDINAPHEAAGTIIRMISEPGWRAGSANAAVANADRWNALAAQDLENARGLFTQDLERSITAGSVKAV